MKNSNDTGKGGHAVLLLKIRLFSGKMHTAQPFTFFAVKPENRLPTLGYGA